MAPQKQDVRFGGQEIDGVFRFELTGGALPLDFVNTLDERRGTPRELLTDPARLLDWSEQVELISPDMRDRIESWAKANSDKASAKLNQVTAARETMFALLAAQASRSRPPKDALRALDGLRRAADEARCLVSGEGIYAWRYTDDRDGFGVIRWPIVHAAADLLVGGEAGRIKLCEGSTCAWAFLDTSRRGNRRWCDMSVCGNRAKVRRHRAKQPTPTEATGAR